MNYQLSWFKNCLLKYKPGNSNTNTTEINY